LNTTERKSLASIAQFPKNVVSLLPPPPPPRSCWELQTKLPLLLFANVKLAFAATAFLFPRN
jgi:hypothetical protein